MIIKSYALQGVNPYILRPTIAEGVQKSGNQNDPHGCCGPQIKYSRLKSVNTAFDSSKFRWKYPGM